MKIWIGSRILFVTFFNDKIGRQPLADVCNLQGPFWFGGSQSILVM